MTMMMIIIIIIYRVEKWGMDLPSPYLGACDANNITTVCSRLSMHDEESHPTNGSPVD
jgi:hypothetical protein